MSSSSRSFIESSLFSSSSSSSSSSGNGNSITAWFNALKRNDLENIKNYIDSGVDIYALDDAGQDAMHHAIINMSPNMVLLLLQAGFDLKRISNTYLTDPSKLASKNSLLFQFTGRTKFNFSSSSTENESSETEKIGYLEFFLMSIGTIIIKSQLGTEKFKPQKILPLIDQVLDLLLCYGLKINERLSKYFRYAFKELNDAANSKDSEIKSFNQLPEDLSTILDEMPSDTVGDKLKKSLAGGVFYLERVYAKHKAEKSAKDTLLSDYLQCTYELKPKLYSAEKEINIHKQQIKSTYLSQMEMHRFFKEANLAEIILDYCRNIENEVAQSRKNNEANIKIWPK